jgi:hypothetical protein
MLHIIPRSREICSLFAMLLICLVEAFEENLNITDLAAAPRDLDAPEAPREVFLAIAMNKAGSVDTMESTFRFDFYLFVAWRDDRQAEGEFAVDGTVWWPQPEIMNWQSGVKGEFQCAFSQGSPKFTKLGIGAGMWGLCQTRHVGFLSASLMMQDFPSDKQDAIIVIESFLWGTSFLTFVPTPKLEAHLLPPTPIPGWTIEEANVKGVKHDYKMFGESYHQLVISLTVRRLSGFYMTRYVLGVAFLVVMCILTLCVPSAEADRFGFAQGSFLGIVSWQFILVTSAPPLGYNTRLDDFMQSSLVCTLIMAAWFAVSSAFSDQRAGREA